MTGTPGTGKKSIAPFLAAELGIPCYSLNELASSYGLLGRGQTPVVDARLLGRKVLRELDGPALLHGHLLPYAFSRRSVSKVVVLRCEPNVLKERLLSRRYGNSKVRENVEAELIGAVAADCYETFGKEKVLEFDSTSGRADKAAKTIAMLTREKRTRPRIDWMRRYDSAKKLRSLLFVPGTVRLRPTHMGRGRGNGNRVSGSDTQQQDGTDERRSPR